MNNKSMLRAFLYILAAIAIHLILIYFLGIRIEGGRGAELILLLCETYALPLTMCLINGLLFISVKRMGDEITWFLFTVIPGSLLLFLFVEMQTAGGGGEDEGIISWEIPRYAVEIIYLLSAAIIIIQLIMSLYYLVNVRVWKKN
ncbi:hypothetical protein [Paenibacillus sp. MMS20-IR301]|uniref:hypothetical protein n=1 Tax=Paenibacillus sp. MMS20-IR301 TaxID=2895946 RepID=UPI0028E469A9|nr:hypothetical protein [Paenibacillus sp. MMS20-IR301]WNS46396.1 hypothetical protein LOS79_14415 [Paenibacillus sp. MMS20-IR301]